MTEPAGPPTTCLLGLDLGGTKLAVALAEPDGRVLESRRLPTLASGGAAQALERALRAAHALVADHAADVRAVGVSTMGISHEDRVDLAPNVPGWDSLSLPGAVRAAFSPAPVVVRNDVKAAALAELRWGELRGVNTGIYLNLGTGVAAALVLDGRVVEGAHGAAGEVGYWWRGRTDGPGAAAGRAPLEAYVGGSGAAVRAERELGITGGVAALVARSEPKAEEFLADLYDEVGLHTANVATAVDPERVVVGGGYVADADRLLPVIRGWLERCVPFPPELRVACFREDAGIVGAMALAASAVPR